MERPRRSAPALEVAAGVALTERPDRCADTVFSRPAAAPPTLNTVSAPPPPRRGPPPPKDSPPSPRHNVSTSQYNTPTRHNVSTRQHSALALTQTSLSARLRNI